MTDRMEKAYYLKEEELAVLLSLKQVRALYGFRMGTGVDMNRKTLHRILFGMAKKNILTISGRQIRMDAGLEAVLADMAEAGSVLTLTGTAEYPECCIYAGRELVFVRLLGQNGKRYRLESVKRQEAGLKMRECGWSVPGVLDKTQTNREEKEQCQRMQELAEMLYGQDKERILQEKKVRCCLMQYVVPQVKKTRQLLILSDVLEDYITVSDGDRSAAYLYSDEKSEELLEQAIGGGL